MPKSQAYKNFVDQFLNANDWPSRKDGCPLELLDELSKDERKSAESELLNRLTPGDDWPIKGLGHIRSKAGLAELKELEKKTEGAMRAGTNGGVLKQLNRISC